MSKKPAASSGDGALGRSLFGRSCKQPVKASIGGAVPGQHTSQAPLLAGHLGLGDEVGSSRDPALDVGGIAPPQVLDAFGADLVPRPAQGDDNLVSSFGGIAPTQVLDVFGADLAPRTAQGDDNLVSSFGGIAPTQVLDAFGADLAPRPTQGDDNPVSSLSGIAPTLVLDAPSADLVPRPARGNDNHVSLFGGIAPHQVLDASGADLVPRPAQGDDNPVSSFGGIAPPQVLGAPGADLVPRPAQGNDIHVSHFGGIAPHQVLDASGADLVPRPAQGDGNHVSSFGGIAPDQVLDVLDAFHLHLPQGNGNIASSIGNFNLSSRDKANASLLPVIPSNSHQIAQAQAVVAATTSPIVHNLLRQVERIHYSLDCVLRERAQINADVVLAASDATHERHEEAIAQVEAAARMDREVQMLEAQVSSIQRQLDEAVRFELDRQRSLNLHPIIPVVGHLRTPITGAPWTAAPWPPIQAVRPQAGHPSGPSSAEPPRAPANRARITSASAQLRDVRNQQSSHPMASARVASRPVVFPSVASERRMKAGGAFDSEERQHIRSAQDVKYEAPSQDSEPGDRDENGYDVNDPFLAPDGDEELFFSDGGQTTDDDECTEQSGDGRLVKQDSGSVMVVTRFCRNRF
jgi:hypothetical protein